MQLVYDAGWQARKVRGILISSLVLAGAAIWVAITLYRTFGLNPADGYGGQLAPVLHRLGLAALISALALSFVAGMFYYSSVYVVRITYQAGDQTYQMVFCGGVLRAPMTMKRDQIVSCHHHHGLARGEGVSVNAPWTIVRVSGQRRPLLIDGQGSILLPRPMAALCRPTS